MKIYLLLGISILFEVTGATFMKLSDGFTKPEVSIFVLICYGIAVSLYISITRNREIGIINAIWSGGGTALITLLALLMFNEAVTITKLIGLGIILTGIIGLTTQEGERCD